MLETLVGWACIIVAIAIACPLVVASAIVGVLFLNLAHEIGREEREKARKP